LIVLSLLSVVGFSLASEQHNLKFSVAFLVLLTASISMLVVGVIE
jgi:hypothetical protein